MSIHVITAWAETASGPGWANSLIWYIYRDADGVLRQACLQPEEQTAEIRTLFGASAVISSQLAGAVNKALEKQNKVVIKYRVLPVTDLSFKILYQVVTARETRPVATMIIYHSDMIKTSQPFKFKSEVEVLYEWAKAEFGQESELDIQEDKNLT